MDRLPGLLTSEEMTLADVLYNDGELHPERFPTDDTRLVALVRQKIRNSQGKCYHVSIILSLHCLRFFFISFFMCSCRKLRHISTHLISSLIAR